MRIVRLGRFAAALLCLFLVVTVLPASVGAQDDPGVTDPGVAEAPPPLVCPAGTAPTADGSACISPAAVCPAGTVLSADGLACIVPAPTCADGQVVAVDGVTCVTPTPQCEAGQILASDGASCIADPNLAEPEGESDTQSPSEQSPSEQSPGEESPPEESPGEDDAPGSDAESGADDSCPDGFELSADGSMCDFAERPGCPTGTILTSDQECVPPPECPSGMILSADLQTCRRESQGCPEGQVLAVAVNACVPEGTACEDGQSIDDEGVCPPPRCDEGDDGCESSAEAEELATACAEGDEACEAAAKAAAAAAEECDEGDTDCIAEAASAAAAEQCEEEDTDCLAAAEREGRCAAALVGDIDAARDAPECNPCPPLHDPGPDGECIEYLDPGHPCVAAGRVPVGVETNEQLIGWAYLSGTGECVTQGEFSRRVANFEASAAAEADALDELHSTTAEVIELQETLAGLEEALEDVQLQLLEAEEAAAFAKIRRDETEKELAAVREELAAERKKLQSQAVDAYIGGGGEQLAELVLNAETPNKFETSLDYADAVLEDQAATIDSVAALETATETVAADLAEAEAAAQEAVAEIARIEEEIEGLISEQQALISETQLKLDQEAAIVSSIRQDKSEYAEELGAFESASKDIEAILAEAQLVVGDLTAYEGTLASPLSPLIIISRFGPRLHPILGYVRPHNGLDMDAPHGAPIYAAAAGRVVVAGTQGGYGLTVVIDHGDGVATLSAHQSALSVESGDVVNRGDIIGFIGSTGLSTGPHLHFEVRVQGTPVDPLPYLSGTS